MRNGCCLAESTVCLIDCAVSDASELVLTVLWNIVEPKAAGSVLSELGTLFSYFTVIIGDLPPWYFTAVVFFSFFFLPDKLRAHEMQMLSNGLAGRK